MIDMGEKGREGEILGEELLEGPWVMPLSATKKKEYGRGLPFLVRQGATRSQTLLGAEVGRGRLRAHRISE